MSELSKCTDCGAEIDEGEIYGEWDDLCHECFLEREDDDE